MWAFTEYSLLSTQNKNHFKACVTSVETKNVNILGWSKDVRQKYLTAASSNCTCLHLFECVNKYFLELAAQLALNSKISWTLGKMIWFSKNGENR